MTDREIEASAVLINYIKEMHFWCIKAIKASEIIERGTDDNGFKPKVDPFIPLRVELREIFAKYCTEKTRKNGPPEHFSLQYPAPYDMNVEEITSIKEVKKNRMEIETRTRLSTLNYDDIYRYTLVFKNNEWRLDRKNWYQSGEDYWMQIELA